MNLTKLLSVKVHFKRAKKKDNYKVTNDATKLETMNN